MPQEEKKSLQRPLEEGLLTQWAMQQVLCFGNLMLPRGKMGKETCSVCGRNTVLARFSGKEAVGTERVTVPYPDQSKRGWVGFISWSLLQKE